MAKDKQKGTAFGVRLRTLREAAGLTQAALAEKAEMQSSVLSRLERAEREPTWPTVLKLAEALGVTPDSFLADDGDE